jgi:hypothetical protein
LDLLKKAEFSFLEEILTTSLAAAQAAAASAVSHFFLCLYSLLLIA